MTARRQRMMWSLTRCDRATWSNEEKIVKLDLKKASCLQKHIKVKICRKVYSEKMENKNPANSNHRKQATQRQDAGPIGHHCTGHRGFILSFEGGFPPSTTWEVCCIRVPGSAGLRLHTHSLSPPVPPSCREWSWGPMWHFLLHNIGWNFLCLIGLPWRPSIVLRRTWALRVCTPRRLTV